MIEIKDLLLRFNNLLLGEEIRVDGVRSILTDVLKTDIKKEDIKIKNNVLYLNIKPIYKSEIFLKKELILSKLEEAFGNKAPSEIR